MIEDRNVKQIINIARAEEIEALKDKKNVEEQVRQTLYNKNSNYSDRQLALTRSQSFGHALNRSKYSHFIKTQNKQCFTPFEKMQMIIS